MNVAETAAGGGKVVTLVGIGPGGADFLTFGAGKALEGADVVFGAGRMISFARSFLERREIPDVLFVEIYAAGRVAEFLEAHPEFSRPVVCLSGDTGFFSGARHFFDVFPGGWNVRVECGISSPVLLASRLKKSWQGWKMLSLHGKSCNATEQIRKSGACFFILSGIGDVNLLGSKICRAQENSVLPSDLEITLAENLSYGDERILKLTPRQMSEYGLNEKKSQQRRLLSVLVENPNPEGPVSFLRDRDFLRREKIPMTKEDVRRLAVCSLGLGESSIIYDIGSGSGSVSVEAARISTGGRVFAIDFREEAVSLTRRNAERFCLENVEFLLGRAEEILESAEIPPPTHVFIGGSGGKIVDIVALSLKRNPLARFAATFVSLEGLSGVLELEKKLPVRNMEVTQISVAKSENVGGFTLMKARNPVWLAFFEGAGGTF